MKIGDVVKLEASIRKNGRYAGKIALIIDTDQWGGYVLNVDGEVKKFHTTQIMGIINETR